MSTVVATRSASTNSHLVIDIGEDTRSRRSLFGYRAPFLSTLGLYERSMRSLLTRGTSLGHLGGRVHTQTKQRIAVLLGMSIAQLRVAAAWAGVFQRGVGRLGYFALSGVIAAFRAVMATPVHAAPPGAAPRYEPRATAPLDMKDLSKVQKDVADMFAKAAKLPDGKSADRAAEKPMVVSKEKPAQPAAVVAKTAAPDRKSPKAPEKVPLVPASPEKEEKTTVSVFVTRPASLAHKPLHIHLAIQGA